LALSSFGKDKLAFGKLGLVKDDAHNDNRVKWRCLTTGNRPTLPQCGNELAQSCGYFATDLSDYDN